MKNPGTLLALLILFAALLSYWLLPIRGQVLITLDSTTPSLLFPQIQLDPPNPEAGSSVSVALTDNVPWANVRLMVNAQSISVQDWHANPGGTWTWRANFARWACPC